jgi:hypothetical protein
MRRLLSIFTGLGLMWCKTFHSGQPHERPHSIHLVPSLPSQVPYSVGTGGTRSYGQSNGETFRLCRAGEGTNRMNANNRPEKVREYLAYHYTDAELKEIAGNLARANQERQSIELRKAQVMADFKAQITEAEGRINREAIRYNNGYEMRDIECGVEYNKPVTGKKTITRLDTDAFVRVSYMSGQEMQEPLPLQNPNEPAAEYVVETEAGKLGTEAANRRAEMPVS